MISRGKSRLWRTPKNLRGERFRTLPLGRQIGVRHERLCVEDRSDRHAGGRQRSTRQGGGQNDPGLREVPQ